MRRGLMLRPEAECSRRVVQVGGAASAFDLKKSECGLGRTSSSQSSAINTC